METSEVKSEALPQAGILLLTELLVSRPNLPTVADSEVSDPTWRAAPCCFEFPC